MAKGASGVGSRFYVRDNLLSLTLSAEIYALLCAVCLSTLVIYCWVQAIAYSYLLYCCTCTPITAAVISNLKCAECITNHSLLVQVLVLVMFSGTLYKYKVCCRWRQGSRRGSTTGSSGRVLGLPYLDNNYFGSRNVWAISFPTMTFLHLAVVAHRQQ